jgi:hypothetical protein
MLSKRLAERGINVLPVTHPAVPAKTSQLRFFLTAMHTQPDIEAAIEATADEFAKLREDAQQFDARRRSWLKRTAGSPSTALAARTGSRVALPPARHG